MSVGTIQEAKSLSERWMSDMGYFTREVTPCPDDLNFVLEGMSPNGIPFIIIHPKKLPRAIVVIVNVRVTESSFASLSSLNKNDRDEFLWNLQREIMFAPPSFFFEPTFEDGGIPRIIQFSEDIWYDELTEGRLAKAVNDTVRSALWVIWSFRRKFGKPTEVKPIE